MDEADLRLTVITMGFSVRYANVSIGEPPQIIEMDLNMLVADFSILTTSGRGGSKFDELFSNSYGIEDIFELLLNLLLIGNLPEKSNVHPYPGCSLPSEIFHLPTVKTTSKLEFTHCRPSKSSLNALGASGSTFGLAPSEQLSETGSASILKQLVEKETIQRPLFSLMLINGREGVLSIGGTAAHALDMVVSQTELALDTLGALERGEAPLIGPKESLQERSLVNEGDSREQGRVNKWEWSKVQGAEGWW